MITAAALAQAGELVAGPAMPDLLGDLAAGSALGSCDVRPVSAGWEDIGLGAITDMVQHALGPVDLDRSPVELAAASRPHPSCRACAGVGFDFPADLAQARDGLCPVHRSKADTVIRGRLARASASNPDGWGALTDASARLELPHLPCGLATKLAGAGEGCGAQQSRFVPGRVVAGHAACRYSWIRPPRMSVRSTARMVSRPWMRTAPARGGRWSRDRCGRWPL